jgi:cell division protein FtsB
MRRTGDNRFFRHSAVYQLLLAVLVCLVLFMLWAVWGVYGKYQEAKARKVLLSTDYAQMVTREEALKEKLDHLKTERGMEEEIRAKFQVAKPGEEVIVLLGEDQEPTTTPQVRSVWESILEYLW